MKYAYRCAGLAEHDRVAAGHPAERVRTRILADAAVRLDLREPDRHAPLIGVVRQHGAEQERRELDRVAREELAPDGDELSDIRRLSDPPPGGPRRGAARGR